MTKWCCLPGAWYICWGSMINWIKFDDTTLEKSSKEFWIEANFPLLLGEGLWNGRWLHTNWIRFRSRSDSPACHIPKKDKKMLVNTFLSMTNFGQRYLCSLPYSLQLCGLWPKQWIHDSYLHEYHLLYCSQTYPICCTPPIKFWSILTGFKKHRKSGRQKWGQSYILFYEHTCYVHLESVTYVTDVCFFPLKSKWRLWKMAFFCFWSINAWFLLLSLWFSDLAKCKNCQATFFLISIDLW